jgi:hypothetical protein
MQGDTLNREYLEEWVKVLGLEQQWADVRQLAG